MENKEVKNETLRDEHLDALIRLAFRREEERTYQQLMEENQQEYTTEEAAQKDAIFARAMEKFAAQEKQRKKRERVLRLKRSVPRIINVAACLVLVLCIAAPIAVARVEFIRVRVMKLLAEIQEDHTCLSLAENDEEAFWIPADWHGEYYPSYLPDDFLISWKSSLYNEIMWRNEAGDIIHYNESYEGDVISVDSSDARITDITLGGNEGLMIEDDGKTTVAWNDGEVYFVIWTTLSADECIEIASSVKRIVK